MTIYATDKTGSDVWTAPFMAELPAQCVESRLVIEAEDGGDDVTILTRPLPLLRWPEKGQQYFEDWMADLRSGQFKQGTGALRLQQPYDVIEYCCLGVFCNRIQPDEWDDQLEYLDDINNLDLGPDDRASMWHGDTSVIPLETLEVLNIPTGLGESFSDTKGPSYMGYTWQDVLARLNDKGLTFKQIASLLEQVTVFV